MCKKHGKPFLYVDLGKELAPVGTVNRWIVNHDIQVLNVARPRKSKHPGIHDQVVGIMKDVLVAMGRAGTGQDDNVIRESVVPFLLAG
ncbi:YpsA SLOG family protein [Desulfocicer niacini]